MPHRHTHPNPYLFICPFEFVPERFNTAHHQFPSHLTLVPPFSLPGSHVAELDAALREFVAKVPPYTVTFGSVETFEYDGVTYEVQQVVEGRLQTIELHLGLLGVLYGLGGTLKDPSTAGLYYSPHTTVASGCTPHEIGAPVPVRTVLAVAKHAKGFVPVVEHEELGDVKDKFMYQGYRLKGQVALAGEDACQSTP